MSKHKRTQLKPGKYVLKNIGRERWVSRLTPMEETEDPKMVRELEGSFLNDTVWSWEIFHAAIPLKDHLASLPKAEPEPVKENDRKADPPAAKKDSRPKKEVKKPAVKPAFKKARK